MIRFAIQTTFTLLITSGAVLYPREGQRLVDIEEKTSFDKFLIGYAILIAVFAAAFIVFTCYVTLCMTNKSILLNKEIKLRKGKPVVDGIKKKFLNEIKQEELTTSHGAQRKFKKQNELKLLGIMEIEAELKKETEKKKYFEEFFVGMVSESRLA